MRRRIDSRPSLLREYRAPVAASSSGVSDGRPSAMERSVGRMATWVTLILNPHDAARDHQPSAAPARAFADPMNVGAEAADATLRGGQSGSLRSRMTRRHPARKLLAAPTTP